MCVSTTSWLRPLFRLFFAILSGAMRWCTVTVVDSIGERYSRDWSRSAIFIGSCYARRYATDRNYARSRATLAGCTYRWPLSSFSSTTTEPSGCLAAIVARRAALPAPMTNTSECWFWIHSLIDTLNWLERRELGQGRGYREAGGQA